MNGDGCIRVKMLKNGNVQHLKLYQSWRNYKNKVCEMQEFTGCLIFYAADSEIKSELMEVKSELHYFLMSMLRNQPTEISEEYAYTLYLRFIKDRLCLFLDKLLHIDKKSIKLYDNFWQAELSNSLNSMRNKFYNEESE